MMQDVELQASESKGLLRAAAEQDVEAQGKAAQADGAGGGAPAAISVSRRALIACAVLMGVVVLVAFVAVAGAAYTARSKPQVLVPSLSPSTAATTD